jgi:hypothetical protein
MCTTFSKLRATLPVVDIAVEHGRGVVVCNDAYSVPRAAEAVHAAGQVAAALLACGFDVTHGPPDGACNLTGVALDRLLTSLAAQGREWVA